MKCSVCGTECSESTKFCPTCGTPLQQGQPQAAQTSVMPGDPLDYRQPSQEFAAQPQDRQAYEPTRQMPPYQQPSGQFSRTPGSQEFKAVPANPAMPGRSVDMSAATKKPVWPIVLIAVLLVLIVVLVLVILHPWDTGAQSGTATVEGGNVVVTSNADGTQAGEGDAAQGTVADTTSDAQQQAPAASSDADVYMQLSASYNQLDGFHNQISSIATEFSDNVGVNDLSDLRNRAADLQSQIQSARATLQAVAVAADSAYAQTKSAIDNLYNDLEMRISVLVQACDAVIAGNDYSGILSADNGPADEHGHTNKYLIDYEQNYAAAQPVQQ